MNRIKIVSETNKIQKYYIRTYYVDIMYYRKRGKIRWAKHSRFQPYEVFHGNTFAVQWPPVFITYVELKIHRKTFAVSSKTAKTVNV